MENRMQDEATLEERFTRYVEEDAGRWHAVHARISALSAAVALLAGTMARDAQDLRAFIAALRGAKAHAGDPAALGELEVLERLISEWLKPRQA